MISNAEFVYRALRNVKSRRAHQLRNITVKDGVTNPRSRGSSHQAGSTIPYTSDELDLLRSIESNLEDLLNLFDLRTEEAVTKGAG